ncbi:MAG: hypothetical protein Q8Q39_04265 [bacterium]|nr:hypothetical protein [bacterium]
MRLDVETILIDAPAGLTTEEVIKKLEKKYAAHSATRDRIEMVLRQVGNWNEKTDGWFLKGEEKAA